MGLLFLKRTFPQIIQHKSRIEFPLRRLISIYIYEISDDFFEMVTNMVTLLLIWFQNIYARDSKKNSQRILGKT